MNSYGFLTAGLSQQLKKHFNFGADLYRDPDPGILTEFSHCGNMCKSVNNEYNA